MIRAPREVWAPRAGRVDLVVEGERHALVRGAAGIFVVGEESAARLRAGARYGFSLDDGPTLPDPRSREQPEGVHALSSVVDDAFPWTHPCFRAPPLSSAVIYELHVGTFTPEGTFDGAARRLDHLVALGVTHVEVMPVASFEGTWGWGYDGVAPFAPHAPYGGPSALRRFVDACHTRGLAVVMDVVYNHLGPSGNVLGSYGPYFTDRHHTPWGSAINFDGPDSDEVRRFFLDNARMWFEEYHVDALRLDAIHGIVDTAAVPFLEELAASTAHMSSILGRPLALIAESDLNDPRVTRPRDIGGLGMDAQWSDDLHHALHVALTGEQAGYYADFKGLPDLATALARGWVYAGQRSRARRRRHGRPFEGTGTRLVAYGQNHDQVGNRAHGDRLAAVAGLARARIAMAVALFAPAIPMLFQGEEWGCTTPFLYFADHRDEALRAAVKAGRRAEHAAFGWQDVPDPEDPHTFMRSRLDWLDLEHPEHAVTLEFARAMVALRRRSPELLDGELSRVRCAVDAAAGWLRVARGTLSLLVNLGRRQRVPWVPRDDGDDAGPARVLLASEQALAPLIRVDARAVELPSDIAVVLEHGSACARRGTRAAGDAHG